MYSEEITREKEKDFLLLAGPDWIWTLDLERHDLSPLLVHAGSRDRPIPLTSIAATFYYTILYMNKISRDRPRISWPKWSDKL